MTVRTAPVALPAMRSTADRPFGIYIHVPFCATRCGYCDFNTYTPPANSAAPTPPTAG